ncbi:alpha/beta family hydrolase [Isoalcanivorax indicus]|uniref:alpha/beta family hydrolase n=1 Tax=Isoalcanivorax indicus TaxID=2202653 RepID=UPI000DB93374|nr:alpha/beta family hydrolase [Isoalcanivorax indicus]
MTELTWQPAASPRATLLLAHGAGAGQDSEAMIALTDALTAAGITVVRFEFPYMVRRRQDGRRRPPDRQPVLLAAFAAALAQVAADPRCTRPLLVGGKSMGGRMATLLMAGDEAPADVAGVVCFGYPFHPPGKPERLRLDHWPALTVPLLVCQGERDTFGSRAEVEGYAREGLLPDAVRLLWLADANHDLTPRKASGLTRADHLQACGRALQAWGPVKAF